MSQASTNKRASTRVSAACQRCRQQKLKCDVQRPCTLCVRAGVTCSAPVRPITWRAHDSGQSVKKSRLLQHRAATLIDLEQSPHSSTSVRDTGLLQASKNNEANNADSLPLPNDGRTECDIPTSTSASSQFLEQAFQQHEESSPNAAETSSFATPQQPRPQNSSPMAAAATQIRHPPTVSEELLNVSTSTITDSKAEMISVLPAYDIAAALVNNYFDRIHWFVLVFHQSEFRQTFDALYAKRQSSRPQQDPSVGFVGVFIAVCILSLSYMDQEQILSLFKNGENNLLLQARLLRTLRSNLLDVAAECSIEAVQTFLLLGSYYVYHGQPQLAWPICGWSLRIAQSLRLHRRSRAESSNAPDLDDPSQRAEETRKRCWWAVYEMETFCSMLYGYPLSINDNDCDVEPLCQYPQRSGDPAWDVISRRNGGQATLLSYKSAMAQLSVIVRAALLELYSLRATHAQPDVCGTHVSCSLSILSQNVLELDAKLSAWASQLPQPLRIERAPTDTAKPCEDYLKRRSGQCAQACCHYLFPLQSLSLKLALENARILVHRPLLSYRMSMSQPRNEELRRRTVDPCQLSVQTCQNAALQIAEICSAPIVKDAGNTYAVAFICLHLLTASISLSILACLNSMTAASHDCKMGLRRLMEMQSRLSSRSIVAKQGFAVSKRLMALLLEKEREQMLNVSTHDESLSHASSTIQDIDEPSRWCDDTDQNTGIDFRSARFPDQNTSSAESNICAGCVTAGDDNDTVLGFQQDHATMQALFDFEQAIHDFPDENSIDTPQFNANGILQTGINLSAQDYSWIWSSNPNLSFP